MLLRGQRVRRSGDGGDKERPESFYSQLVPLEAVQTAQMNQGHVAWMVTSQCGPVKPPGRARKTCCRWFYEPGPHCVTVSLTEPPCFASEEPSTDDGGSEVEAGEHGGG
jgi:hypothetical protein